MYYTTAQNLMYRPQIPGSKSERKIGLLATLFGCWHKNLSRPFKHGELSHVVCLDCGARKEFSEKTFKTSGMFCYPPKPSTGR